MHHCSAALVPPPPPTETVLQLLYYLAAVWPSILCLSCIYFHFVNRMSVFVLKKPYYWNSCTPELLSDLQACLPLADQLSHNVTHIQSWGWGSWAGFWTLRCLHSTLNIWGGKLKSQTLLTFKHACCPGSPDPDSSLPAAYIHKHSQIQIHPWTLANINTSFKTEALTCILLHLSPGNCKYW